MAQKLALNATKQRVFPTKKRKSISCVDHAWTPDILVATVPRRICPARQIALQTLAIATFSATIP
jgi:hypothetical protein